MTSSCMITLLAGGHAHTHASMHIYVYIPPPPRHADLFRDHLWDLPEDEEVWVMDYIENFSCFQEFALQQDHFGHEQVTIFVIMCFRHRRDGEHVESPTFRLPPHLTAELHAFFSEDKEHDTGFAQMCINMVMDAKECAEVLPTRVRNWSDGGRAHFKNYR